MRRLLDFRSKKGKAKIPAELSSTSSASAEPAATPSLPPQATDEVLQGLQVVCEGTNPVVDIVAVHGLNGHCEKTWTAGSGADSINWLRDLLPHDLPNARILSWGYDANTHSGSRISTQYLYDHGRGLVSDLCLHRQLTESSKRPIIFVAHSLGGIIVKSALIHSDAARRGALEEHRAIKLSTYGILFMGTPHQGGSGVALGKLMVNVASVFMAADDRLLQHLERDSEWLQQQLGQYGTISGDFVTKFAFEEYATPTVLGKSIMVVPRASAVVPGAADSEPIAIHADHIHMVKFRSKTDPGYKTVSGHLRLMAAKAGTSIDGRWDTEAKLNAVHFEEPTASFAVQFSVPEVSRVDHFVGRSEELDTIHRELQHDRCRKTAVMHGLGGMGKTQLALAYAQRYKDEYSAVFWVNSKDVDTLKQGYAAAARRIYRDRPSLAYLKAAAEGNNLNEAVEVVKRWLSSARNDGWLVIYDNYDTPKLPGHDEPGTFDIRPFLPEADQGAVLITTRSSQLQLGRPIAVKKLRDIEHSLEILSQTSRRDGLVLDPDARKLAEELDGLPLALATAGAYLYQLSTSLAEYLRMYKASWLQLQRDTPQLLTYEDKALYTTWAISLDSIKHRVSMDHSNDLAVKFLQLWAYLDNQDVWFELLQSARQRDCPEWFSELTQDQLSFNKAVRVLCNHGLAEAHTFSGEDSVESQGYSMHSCVHAWTKHVVNERWDNALAGLALRCVGLHVPYKIRPKYWVIQQRLLRHANRCQEFIGVVIKERDTEGSLYEAIHKLGNLYSKHGKLDKAEEMYQIALQGREKAFGPGDTSTLSTVNRLGNLYRRQGKLDKTEEMYQRALQGSEKALGPNHPSTLSTISNLGILYRNQGKLDKAEEIYQRVLQDKETALGPGHMSTLDTVNNLGVLYINQGKLNKAEEMYQRALQGYEKVLGHDHTSTLRTVNNLGILYRKQGKLDKAEEIYQLALQGREEALGPDHTSTLDTVSHLGNLYADQGKLDKAEEMYQRALQGYEAHFGPDDLRCRKLRHALVKLQNRVGT
ncbi:hypothetical protein yc1106_00279 [Curvularia clavata]|uniref:NB-ARC domain-containing protein n=1 Tax=Curvularia clavata TaxID=95742 RepID=A0A9Q8Z032_CURCL|nr:hypothetical protein yc1106_00279 [Curvularia clavata]